ncbi:MAG: hypothetical protein IPG60_02535 [Bacteroidetes bacterium]|nr:hypothetical protein [Bacteroidota bacterium]MBP7399577.1 hypothetical protein [Chitinophagales bacterium]MBK7108372.1 hypothetical protein [Bacteroidota bacterium]MBK8486204.1 hypothetical protein [Bacteroidota bacterium]MBK8681154.1 hypothetical protein [Bacteroidota bacterium]
MKRILLQFAITFFAISVFAQQGTTEISTKNSWLKAGVSAGIPIGDLSDYNNFILGLDLKGQVMETPHFGVGLTTGYNHYFAKDQFEDFGIIPLGLFIRVYPKSEGFFAGADVGYSVLTGIENGEGGYFVKPQIGFHNYSWNFFGYYNGIYRSADVGGNINSVGIGATYNIRFK